MKKITLVLVCAVFFAMPFAVCETIASDVAVSSENNSGQTETESARPADERSDSGEPLAPKEQEQSAKSAEEESIVPQDTATVETESELTAQARETYAYLLFMRAILDEDEAALLNAAPLLNGLPASVWLDGAIWLMGRKSPNSVPYLELALGACPDDISLTLLHAEALGEHGLAAKGVEAMRAYLRKHPDSLDARLELALLLVKDRQFEAAQKLLGEITPKQRTPLVDYYQARALMGMGRRQDAIPFLQKSVRSMPDFVEGLAELAFAYEQDGAWREARNIYEKLQKLNFSPQDVSLRLVSLSLKLKQPERALQYIKRGPDSLPFKLTVANMLMDSRHYLQAESILKQIAASSYVPDEVYLLLADIVYEQRHNLGMALSWLEKIPHDSKMAARATLLRAQLMAESGNLADALREVTENIKRFPDMLELRDFEIRLLAKEKRTGEALAEARAAVKKWPDNAELNFLLGSLLDESGEKKEALEIMEGILKKHPDNFQALNYVGYTLAEENRDIPRALELLLKANELSPNQAYIVDSLAWAHYKSGNGAEALRQIRRAVGLGERIDAAIWEHYGDIAKSQGKRSEARKAYRKALDQKPANAEKIRSKLSNP